MAYYDFLKNMWVMGRITIEQVQQAVVKGYITQAEANEILSLPQMK